MKKIFMKNYQFYYCCPQLMFIMPVIYSMFRLLHIKGFLFLVKLRRI